MLQQLLGKFCLLCGLNSRPCAAVGRLSHAVHCLLCVSYHCPAVCSNREIIAAFSGAEVDKLVETKGLDYVDAGKW